MHIHLPAAASEPGNNLHLLRAHAQTLPDETLVMASLADNSIASVPLPQLDHLKDQLLKVARPPQAVSTAPAPTRDDPKAERAAMSSSSSSQPARLATSKSAPPQQTDLEAAVAASSSCLSSSKDRQLRVPGTPSQHDAPAKMQRASSFHGYPGGDTQPMESQVYRDFSESMARSSVATPLKNGRNPMLLPPTWPEEEDGFGETYDTMATDKSQKTCQEGDTGFINLVDGYQPSPVQLQTSQQSDFNDLLAQSTQTVRFQDTSSLARPPDDVPETPAAGLAGKKHGRDGSILNSAATTAAPPTTDGKMRGYSQFFQGGNQGDVLTATQLFEQTQAPSSPVPEGLPLSDPVMTRPSPNNLIQRFSVSSPELPISSPMPPPPFSSTAIEPRGTYTSLRESQEEHHRRAQLRAAELRRENGLQHRFGDNLDHDDVFEGSDEEKDSVRLAHERKRHKRDLADQALSDWAQISAPVRPGSRPGSGRRKDADVPMIDLVTSPFVPEGKKEQKKGERIEFDDDDEVTDDERGGKDEKDHETDLVLVEDDEAGNVEAGDYDEYDELGQTVLRSQSQNQGDLESEISGVEINDDNQGDEEAPFDTTGGQAEERQEDDHVVDESTYAGSVRDDHGVERSTQPGSQQLAIADSQPDRQAAAQIPVSQPKANNHSSAPSFVPGSQYTGQTSQDRAQHSKGKNTSSSSQWRSAARADDGQVPSSPPLPPTTTNDLPDGMSAVQEGTKHSAPEGPAVHTHVDEVLESDIAAADRPSSPHPNNSNNADTNNVPNNLTESAPLFSTARTHVSNSNESPHRRPRRPLSKESSTLSPLKRVAAASQQSSKTSSSSSTTQSPRKAAGVRGFGEILAEASQSRDDGVDGHGDGGSGRVDFDALLDDVQVMTELDQMELRAASASRPRSRARDRETEGESGSRKVEQQVGFSPARESSGLSTPDDDGDDDDEAASEQPESQTEARSAPAGPIAASSTALRTSTLSKANEMPPSTLADKEEAMQDAANTPDSVKQREKAGATAVSQMLSKRTVAPAGGAKGKKKGGIGSGSVRRNMKASAPKVSKVSKVAKPARKGKALSRAGKSKGMNKTADVPVEGQEGPATEEPEVEHSAAEEQRVELTVGEALDGDQPGEGIPMVNVADNTEGQTAQHDDGPHQNQPLQPRVFAMFKSPGFNNFYPATLLSSHPDGKTHRVRFDDGNVASVDAHLVRNLDLRLDDVVKIDLPGMRSKACFVKGFGAAMQSSTGTDVHGHRFVKVQARSGRASLPGNAGQIEQGQDELQEVEVEKVYLPPSMWRPFEVRGLTIPSTSSGGAAVRAETPSGAMHATDAATPGSRTRRSLLPGANKLQEKYGREDSVASAGLPAEKGLFANMAFAISYGDNEAEKATVTRLITRNGGIILETGFDKLFDLSDLDDVPSNAPADNTKDSSTAVAAEPSSLRLKAEFASLGFVALIADRHSRRAKYVQALSLGLPTLSGKWITDSLSPQKNPSVSSTGNVAATTLSWSRYLLPAGESAYLDGAVRSRTLQAYSPAEAKLETIIRDRNRLLGKRDGDDAVSVLFVVPTKKNKTACWVKRRTFAFLTLALGAARVKRVGDLDEARKALRTSASDSATAAQAGNWQWVYVDGDVTEAIQVLFGTKKGGKSGKGVVGNSSSSGSKRGYSSAGRAAGAGESSIVNGMVRVVNDEFVLQSLILGDLLD